MDVALWMQEDGTGIFGSLVFATEVFDVATMQRVAKHLVVRTGTHDQVVASNWAESCSA